MITSDFNGYQIGLIETDDEFFEAIKSFDTNVAIGIDTETTGLCYTNDVIVGICISGGKSYSKKDYKGYYIPLRHRNYTNLKIDIVLPEVQKILLTHKSYFFNRNFDAFMLEKEGIKIPFIGKMHDCQVMAHLVYNESFPSLEKYVANYLKWEVSSFKETLKDETDFSYTNPRVTYTYAAADPVMTVQLARHIWNSYPYVQKIYKIDNYALEAVRRLSKVSLLLDEKVIKDEIEKEQAHLREVLNSIFQISGYHFNPDSNKEKAEALSRFVTLTAKTAKGNYQVNEEALTILAESNEGTRGATLARLLIEYAGIKKYISSYLDKLITYVGNDFRINYSSVNVATGRLSSGGSKKNEYYRTFNIQNVPKIEKVVSLEKDEIYGYRVTDKETDIKVKIKSGLREAFIAPEGYSWMTFDYAQQELKIAANLSKEFVFIDAVKRGEDLHSAVAKKMFGEVSPDDRTKVKTLNFAILYGATKFTIAKRLKIAIDYAGELMDHYFKTLRNLDNWIKESIRIARTRGIVFTYYGRPRILYKYYNRSEPGMAAFADRSAVNTICQGCLPANSFLELEKEVVVFTEVLGDRIMEGNVKLIPTLRGDNELVFITFSGGEFIVCDTNHKFVKKGPIDEGLREVPLRNGFYKKSVVTSPMRKRKLIPILNKTFYRRKGELSNLIKLMVKTRNRISAGDKNINAAFWKLALTRKSFMVSNKIYAGNLRSLASLYGFNVKYNIKTNKFRICFTRRHSVRFKNMEWLGKGMTASCTVENGYQVYKAQGFWNKNTGGDIIRIVLVRLEKERLSNPEFAKNVILVNTVHDECNFFVKNEYRYQADKIIKKIMTINPSNFEIPLEVEGGLGPNWGACVDYKELNEDGTIKTLKL